MSTALQLQTDTMADWKLLCEQAAILIKTGFLPKSITTAEQAVAIVLTGRELGIGMMAALNNINVIQGKPTVNPQMMLALIHRSGQLEDMAIEASKDGAKCMMQRKGKAPYVARFGPAEAKAMGLDGKDNYKKQPATMYQWRAVAAAARVTFPDVLNGLYTPEEMGADTDAETGEIIEAPAVEILPAHMSEAAEDTHAVIMEMTGAYGVERPVKLEGVQPTDRQADDLPDMNGAAGHVIELARKLKWGASEVTHAIDRMSGVVVAPGKLKDYLEIASTDELRELYRSLQGKK